MSVSQTGFGVDVSVTRADELEKRLLAVIQPNDRVLDLGCGAGGAAARLAAAGAAVVGIDAHDFSNDWPAEAGSFMQRDIRQIEFLLGAQQFDYCLCNRTIHYLQYEQAAALLQQLHHHVRQQLFISFSGVTSDLARDYDAALQPIESRFGTLSEPDQTTFGITAPLTLYSQPEALTSLTTTGWNVTWSRTTDFGNVLAQASA